MTLQQLKYVIEVAECGSITEAARLLHISQPSVSNSIRELEAEVQITIFIRSRKGIKLSTDGREFLSYARQVVQQAAMLESRFITERSAKQWFCVSTHHHPFASQAFIQMIREFGLEEYEFALNETKTHDIIENVLTMFSEIGILYISDYNRSVIEKILKDKDLAFHRLFTTVPHVLLSSNHPLAQHKQISLVDLELFPYLSYCQGAHASFYFSEEVLNSYKPKKIIKVSDRAAMVDCMAGLNGYTITGGVKPGEGYQNPIISIPLQLDSEVQIGYIVNKARHLSELCERYIEILKLINIA